MVCEHGDHDVEVDVERDGAPTRRSGLKERTASARRYSLFIRRVAGRWQQRGGAPR